MFKELVDFIRELYNTPTDFIPLHEPRFRGNEKKYLNDCIDSTFVSSVGEYVNRFESDICKITGAKYAVATTNGTTGLHTALLVGGVESGDEVITQSISFVATCNAISYCNATAHFVDVDKDTLSLSPTILRKHLEKISYQKNGECFNSETGKRIKACVPMHTFGLVGKIDELKNICDDFNILLIEDAAESLGSTFKDQHTGTFGKLGVISFNGNKITTCGGGGVIVTNDEQLAKRAKHITTTAKQAHKWEYKHDEVGYNYRLPNLNAALACAQLEQLDDFVKNKRETAEQYHQFLSQNGIPFIKEIDQSKSNYWLNTVLLNDRQERDQFLKYSNENGVMTRPIWKLLSELEMFKHCPKSNLDNSNYIGDRIVNLPSSVI